MRRGGGSGRWPARSPGRYSARIEGDFIVSLIGMRINRPWKVQPLVAGRRRHASDAQGARGRPRQRPPSRPPGPDRRAGGPSSTGGASSTSALGPRPPATPPPGTSSTGGSARRGTSSARDLPGGRQVRTRPSTGTCPGSGSPRRPSTSRPPSSRSRAARRAGRRETDDLPMPVYPNPSADDGRASFQGPKSAIESVRGAPGRPDGRRPERLAGRRRARPCRQPPKSTPSSASAGSGR